MQALGTRSVGVHTAHCSPCPWTPTCPSNLAPGGSEGPVLLKSKATGNQTQQTYLMGPSTQLSDPRVMGLDFSSSKTMTDVQTERCKALWPGGRLGTLTAPGESRPHLWCHGGHTCHTPPRPSPPSLAQTLENFGVNPKVHVIAHCSL